MQLDLTDDELMLVRSAVAVYGNNIQDAINYMSHKNARDRNGNPPTKADLDKAWDRLRAIDAFYQRIAE